MRYKPERALTLDRHIFSNLTHVLGVEMRYKPERALTHFGDVRIPEFESG